MTPTDSPDRRARSIGISVDTSSGPSGRGPVPPNVTIAEAPSARAASADRPIARRLVLRSAGVSTETTLTWVVAASVVGPAGAAGAGLDAPDGASARASAA